MVDETLEDTPAVCHRCSCLLERGEGSFWNVRIDAVCDPSPPNLETVELIEDAQRRWWELIDALDDLSEQELMDQVHRRLALQLCSTCFRAWIENPTG